MASYMPAGQLAASIPRRGRWVLLMMQPELDGMPHASRPSSRIEVLFTDRI